MPSPLQLDLHDGVAYVGVVPFVMQCVRPRWWPKALGFNFLEANVRTYVVHGDQPGVYFFSLEATSQLAVWAARRFWGLPYFHADMSIQHTGDQTRFSSKRCGTGVRHNVRFQPGAMLGASQPGTLEHFLLERYLLFVQHRGAIHVGQVHHPPYPAQAVEILELHDELAGAAGIETSGQPTFAHFVAGIDVEVYALQPCHRVNGSHDAR